MMLRSTNQRILSKVTRSLVVRRGFSVSTARPKEKLVILGSGWGGYGVLSRVDKKRYDVSVISATNYFNFTPLLASTAVGTLEYRCAIEPVRRYAPQVRAYQAWCDKIDFKQKQLTCVPATPLPSKSERPQSDYSGGPSHLSVGGAEYTISYDKLVIAVGAYAQTFNIPGVKENAYFLRGVSDARAIRSRILECFETASQPNVSDTERAKLLHFCIVGAGPTGVEFAAELHDLISAEMKRHYPTLARLSRITLYDVAPNILGTFDKGLAEYAEKKFRRDGISMRLNHHVKKVEPGKMFVDEQGEVDFGLLVWSTGLASNPLIQGIQEVEKHNKTKSLFTDEKLNVIMSGTGEPNEDVWAIGDAAIIKSQPLPATAQVAEQKAKYVSKNLNRMAKDTSITASSLNPFEFHNMGSLAYLGNWKAIYDRPESPNQTPIIGKEAGRLAWLLWRSAYFSKTLSIRNKFSDFNYRALILVLELDIWSRHNTILSCISTQCSKQE